MSDTAHKAQAVSSYVSDDSLIEMVYDEKNKSTALAMCADGKITYHQSITLDGLNLKPLSPRNDVVGGKVILFPSQASEYVVDKELIDTIKSFIHRYVDITPFYEEIASYYVLLSWVYGVFNEVPYLRVIGDYGSGKTRFLQVIGSLCYKPIFAGGATTASPIFRMLHQHHGTLVLDEADFQFSDATADIVKILNNGHARGFSVLRAEGLGKYEVKTYDVYSPKVLATREKFKDTALESRCLTEEMGQRKLRDDIPLSLPRAFYTEALDLRNKLLTWRFRNYREINVVETALDMNIHPRLKQIILPLLSIIRSDEVKQGLKAFIARYHNAMITDQGMRREADILAALLLCAESRAMEITVKHVADTYNFDIDEYEAISYKKMGWWLRHRLGFTLVRKEQGFVIPMSENEERIALLKEKYGLGNEASQMALTLENTGKEASQQAEDATDPSQYSPF